MSVNRSILIACAIVGLAFAALAFVAEGQSPASQRPVLVAAAATAGTSSATPAASPATCRCPGAAGTGFPAAKRKQCSEWRGYET